MTHSTPRCIIYNKAIERTLGCSISTFSTLLVILEDARISKQNDSTIHGIQEEENEMNVTAELTTAQEVLRKDKQPIPPAMVQTDAEQKALRDYAEAQLRKLSASRGLNWDKMTDEERIDFVDDLIHEDRACKR